MESVENKGELIGYVVPFDIPSESLKKGEILRHKHGLDDDMFENIEILNSSYCLVPEWVETWEKVYKQVETSPDKFQQVIELIEKQIEFRKDSVIDRLEGKNYLAVGYDEIRIKELEFILQEIKAL